MSKKVALSSLISHVNGIITLKDKDAEFIGLVKKYLGIILDDSASLYGFILHDKDVDDDGKIKTPHIHFVANLKKRVRVATMINRIAKACDLDTLAITIDKYQSFEGSFQYLIHQNNPNKHHYPIEDVVTNVPEDDIDLILDSTTSVLDFDSLVGACKIANDVLDVIEDIGLSAYKSYRMVVLDVFQCVKRRQQSEKCFEVQGL